MKLVAVQLRAELRRVAANGEQLLLTLGIPVMLLVFFTQSRFNAGKVDDPTRQLVETESLSEHVGSISYKSQAENMFVVYLYDKDAGVSAADADVEVEPTDDMVIQ